MTAIEPINLLLIEDEAYDVRRVRSTLQPFEARIRIRDVVSDGQEALELLAKDSKKYDVVIMDFQIAGALIGKLNGESKRSTCMPIIVVTKMTINVTDFDFASKLLEAGDVVLHQYPVISTSLSINPPISC
jgi:DNA-binding NarL/FixJ family response regulator